MSDNVKNLKTKRKAEGKLHGAEKLLCPHCPIARPAPSQIPLFVGSSLPSVSLLLHAPPSLFTQESPRSDGMQFVPQVSWIKKKKIHKDSVLTALWYEIIPYKPPLSGLLPYTGSGYKAVAGTTLCEDGDRQWEKRTFLLQCRIPRTPRSESILG